MAKTLQFRRGTTSELSSETGSVGELFVDTTKDTVVVMDGSTAGGFALATEQYVDTSVSDLFNSSSTDLSGPTSIYWAASFTQVRFNTTDGAWKSAAESAATTATKFVITTSSSTFEYDNANYPVNSTIDGPSSGPFYGYIWNGWNPSGWIGSAPTDQSVISITGFSAAVTSQIDDAITANVSSQIDAALTTKQDTLVSGSNIKTINGNSLLGSGDIAISGGGTGSSFDQELNTTDDVVFNSALIGNISIIDNQIAVEDSYGLPSSLNVSASEVVFNSNVNLTIDSRNNITETINGTSQFIANAEMFSSTFQYSPPEEQSWTDAPKFVTGTIVTITDSTYGTKVIRLTTDMTYSMMNGWTANYVRVGGSTNTGSDFRSYSVDVTNESGTVVNYGFDDQGTFTASTISTTELLVNGNTPAYLTANEDGSKSIVVDTLTESSDTLDISAFGQVRWIQDNDNKWYFMIPTTSYSTYGDYFNAGTVVTGFYDAAGKAGPFTLTLATGLTNRMISAYSGYAAETVEPNPSTNNNLYSSEITATNASGTIVDYQFTDSGFIAETALIGDVSIVNNTISSVDSYGLPDTLVVDGDLEVTGALINDATLSLNEDGSKSVLIGGLITTTETVSGGEGASSGTFYINGNMGMPSNTFKFEKMGGGDTWADSSKFVTGSIVTMSSPMYGGTYVIELTSNITYNMMWGWTASYIKISGGDLNMQTPRASSVDVTNQTNSLVDYQFTDSGFIAETALIGDVSIVGNAISGVDSYGLSDTLVVDGDLEVTGALINDATLSLNEDGSKSIVVDTSSSTTNTLNIDGFGQVQWFQYSDKWYFFIPSTAYQFFSDYFNAGTVVTGFYDAAGKAGPFTLTLATDLVYGNYNGYTGYAAETVEPNTAGNYNIYAPEVTVTNSSGTIVDYRFTSDALDIPTINAESLITETALIGDVSIVNNTISSVDSYGLPDTLVVDGDLEVTGGLDITNVSTLETIYTFNSPAGPGQWSGNISWNGTTLFWNASDSPVIALIESLNVGDTITFADSMNYPTPVTVTLTSTMEYSMGDMAYIATVAENNNTGMSIGAANDPITIISLITKTSSFDSTGLTVDGTANAEQFKVLGADDGFGNNPVSILANGYVYLKQDDSEYVSRTQLTPTTIATYNVVPGTLADGAVVERSVLSAVTSPTTYSSATLAMSHPASLNGDISIIEAVVSAINADSSVLTTKAWKIRAYAYRINNAITITPIGTPEVLVDIDGLGGTSGTSALSVSFIDNGVVALQISNTDNTYAYTWGAEITVWTTHVNIASGGGGK